jgi:hypothetical protein
MLLLQANQSSHWRPQFIHTVSFLSSILGVPTVSFKSGEAKADQLQVSHIPIMLHLLRCWNLL